MENLPINKRYYTISEVARLFDVSIPKLRFWEENFPSLKIERDKSGDRKFTRKDIEHLQMIYELVEEKRLTLEGARKYIKNKEHKIQENAQYIAQLQQVRAFLLVLREKVAETGKEDSEDELGEEYPISSAP
ncbi:MAG: MerR family transcriptional regulator [Cytophagaceae bacterium]|nr:MerR family transcriptional regulator [Cytophagaceae bacterium]